MEMTCYNNYNNDRHTFEIYQRERTCLKSFHWFVISGEANHDHTKTIRMLTVIWSYISKCYNNNNTSMTSVICPFLLPFSCMTVYVYSLRFILYNCMSLLYRNIWFEWKNWTWTCKTYQYALIDIMNLWIHIYHLSSISGDGSNQF